MSTTSNEPIATVDPGANDARINRMVANLPMMGVAAAQMANTGTGEFDVTLQPESGLTPASPGVHRPQPEAMGNMPTKTDEIAAQLKVPLTQDEVLTPSQQQAMKKHQMATKFLHDRKTSLDLNLFGHSRGLTKFMK